SLSLSVNQTTPRNNPKPSHHINAPSLPVSCPTKPRPPTPPTANGKSGSNPATTTSTTNNPAPSSQCNAPKCQACLKYYYLGHCQSNKFY
ncbi:hypothetical protein, partial [Bacteroides acidifaciens]|uniref:hypothetical protein n=1 Tax=Bacteroides acidifaciens TaxID=85831 RepID=UPI00242DAC6C